MSCLRPITLGLLLSLAVPLSAQSNGSAGAPNPQPSRAPVVLTFQDALQRAQANEPQFLNVKTALGVAQQDKVQARSALLPSVTYNAGYLYTQPNGTPTGVFIANNAVREYVSQGNAHEEIDGAQFYANQRASAAAALARAQLEIAARGLTVIVAQSYYGLAVAQRKYASAQAALTEAQRFLQISRQLEQGGEIAHSDVVKAQIQFNEQQVALQEAQLASDKARLALAVLVFPNFNQNFTVADDLDLAPPLPTLGEVQVLASKGNPQLQAAFASLDVANAELSSAWSGHFPSLSLDYWYGIDAGQFAVRAPDSTRNLGYAAAVTLNVPVWNWGAVQSKVKQAELQQRQARVELSYTQRQLLANVQSFYQEAQTARGQLETLRQSFELASESLRLTTLRYQGGEATVLEVVDAQNTLTQARGTYADGQLRYRVALADLQTLTGAF